MPRRLLFALLLTVASLVLFSLLAPLLFRGPDLRQAGQIGLPLIVIVAGLGGFFLGRRPAGKQ